MITSKRRRKATLPPHPGVAWLALIEDSGLSQAAVAQAMGVSKMTLNRLVNGQGIPTANVTVAFARAMDTDPVELWHTVCDYELALALRNAEVHR